MLLCQLQRTHHWQMVVGHATPGFFAKSMFNPGERERTFTLTTKFITCNGLSAVAQWSEEQISGC